VPDSAQRSLDTGSNAATILSFMVSFAPFCGSALSQGVQSVSDFLQTKEMKSNARILKGLAPDAVSLSQLIGKSGYGIIMDKKKQEQIINTTEKDLNKAGPGAFQKVFEFCRQVSDKIDVFLYTQLYKTAPERIGNNDANDLIEIWTKGKIMPYGIEDQFIDRIIQNLDAPEGRKEESPTKAPQQESRSACCNMF